MFKLLFICVIGLVNLLSPIYLTAQQIEPLSLDLYIYQTRVVPDRIGNSFPSLTGDKPKGSCGNGYTLHTYCAYEVVIPVNTRYHAKGKILTIKIKSIFHGKNEILGTKDIICESNYQLEVVTIFPSSAGKYGEGFIDIELYDGNNRIGYHSCVIKIVK